MQVPCFVKTIGLTLALASLITPGTWPILVAQTSLYEVLLYKAEKTEGVAKGVWEFLSALSFGWGLGNLSMTALHEMGHFLAIKALFTSQSISLSITPGWIIPRGQTAFSHWTMRPWASAYFSQRSAQALFFAAGPLFALIASCCLFSWDQYKEQKGGEASQAGTFSMMTHALSSFRLENDFYKIEALLGISHIAQRAIFVFMWIVFRIKEGLPMFFRPKAEDPFKPPTGSGAPGFHFGRPGPFGKA